jgi:hypothetical protein
MQMKKLTALVLFSMLALPVVAVAQDADEPQTKFIDFGEMLIDGELQKPQGMFNTERGRARFQSLLSLRRSFLPDIEKASQEEGLK